MAMKFLSRTPLVALLTIALFAYVAAVSAQNTNSDIANTRHNLSASGPGPAKATSESQICVFCHTPHAANAAAPGPLWNRQLSGATYTPYTSSSLDAAAILGGQLGQPGGSSKLCLSCHDGTLALGTVSNAPGSGGAGGTIAMTGTGAGGTMPEGAGVSTGFTRNLGTDLRNDHPISFRFDETLAIRDGELRTPPYSSGGNLIVGARSGGARPLLPLDHDNHVQCTTCHDPHLDASKFLRLNRLQTVGPTGGDFIPASDQICLGCHDRLGFSWARSAHADSNVANYTYKNDAAELRDFPLGTKVWQAACLNCHDTHSVQGSRRLLREGTDSTSSPKAGGNPALEETCYQCHTTSAASIIAADGGGVVPNIKDEFARTVRMPITTADQAASPEVHDIGGNFNDGFNNCTTPENRCGADFIESRERLGRGNLNNRHAECTDCHNPHRVVRNSKFYGTPGDANSSKRTHDVGGVEGNIASGALRGTWGVEPVYGSFTTWPQLPLDYVVKRGDPGANTSIARTATYLTREYQLCFRCHSDFAYNDNNEYGSGSTSSNNTDTKGEASGRPLLTNTSGGTASGTNRVTAFTNQAAEWAVGANDAGSGADQGGAAANRRSWHPVTFPTGRTLAVRGITGTTPWLSPFNTATGTLTMHCSDCHGADSGSVQGPHGSNTKFILKADWGESTNNQNSNHLCFRCHDSAVYIGTATGTARTGFGSASNYHNLHNDASASAARNRCTICHIAVPHGWKNRSLLVNLREVGREGGFSSNTHIADSQLSSTPTSGYTNPPYYLNAKLKILEWRASGNWREASCGSNTNSTDNYGEGWMNANCGG